MALILSGAFYSRASNKTRCSASARSSSRCSLSTPRAVYSQRRKREDATRRLSAERGGVAYSLCLASPFADAVSPIWKLGDASVSSASPPLALSSSSTLAWLRATLSSPSLSLLSSSLFSLSVSPWTPCLAQLLSSFAHPIKRLPRKRRYRESWSRERRDARL